MDDSKRGLTGLAVWVSLAVSLDAHGGELQVMVVDASGHPKPQVVIELIAPGVARPADWPMTGVMDQINKEFIGPVLTIVAGSTVSFPNSDDVHHHVYSFSPAKRFELPLYTGDTAAPVVFDTPGIVTIGCNIHDWMVGYIYVGQSHLMAVSSSEGVAHIPDLPAGDYTARIWHSGLKAGEDLPQVNFAVSESGITQINYTVTDTPSHSLRRAPLPGLRQY